MVLRNMVTNLTNNIHGFVPCGNTTAVTRNSTHVNSCTFNTFLVTLQLTAAAHTRYWSLDCTKLLLYSCNRVLSIPTYRCRPNMKAGLPIMNPCTCSCAPCSGNVSRRCPDRRRSLRLQRAPVIRRSSLSTWRACSRWRLARSHPEAPPAAARLAGVAQTVRSQALAGGPDPTAKRELGQPVAIELGSRLRAPHTSPRPWSSVSRHHEWREQSIQVIKFGVG